MRNTTTILLVISLITGSCIKDKDMPSLQQRLESGAERTFHHSVRAAVETMRFCQLFQEYLEASGDDKSLEKFSEINKSVTKTEENTYEIKYSGTLSTNGTSINETGGAMIFKEIGLSVDCTGELEWEIKFESKRENNDYQNLNYNAIYKKKVTGDSDLAKITINGDLVSGNEDTKGYTIKFESEGDITYLGGQTYVGLFKITTFDNEGDKLDDYSLNFGDSY